MANYVFGAFGDDLQLSSGVGFNYTAPDLFGTATSPGVTSSSSGDSGAGSGFDWNALISGGLGLGTAIAHAVTPAATPAPTPTLGLATGSSSSLFAGSSIAILALGAAAIFLLAKK